MCFKFLNIKHIFLRCSFFTVHPLSFRLPFNSTVGKYYSAIQQSRTPLSLVSISQAHAPAPVFPRFVRMITWELFSLRSFRLMQTKTFQMLILAILRFFWVGSPLASCTRSLLQMCGKYGINSFTSYSRESNISHFTGKWKDSCRSTSQRVWRVCSWN